MHDGFHLSETSAPALEPTFPSIRWVVGAPFPEVRREGDHTNLVLRLKYAWSYTSTLHMTLASTETSLRRCLMTFFMFYGSVNGEYRFSA